MNNLKFIANFNKKLSKFINNLLEKNLNKLNVDNFKNLSINNKIFLSIVALIILFLSYLSFPNIHNKEEVASEIKKNLKNKLNLEFNFQEDLDYKFLKLLTFNLFKFFSNRLLINLLNFLKKLAINLGLFILSNNLIKHYFE